MMVSTATLLSAIRTTLGSAISPSYTATARKWDLYEVYNFCLVLEEGWKAGALRPSSSNPVFRNRDGSPATSYTFRIGPGRLNALDNYTYAELNFRDKEPLEVHTGVYVSERAPEKTEIDVCVLLQSEANFFRTNGVRTRRRELPRWWPDSSKVLIAIECKYLTKDLRAAATHEFIGRYKALSAKVNSYLVTNTLSTVAGHRVLDNCDENSWQKEVVPTLPNEENRWRGVLHQVFSSYVSGHRNFS